MTSVTIGPGMDAHELVMQTDSNFVQRVGVVLQPGPGIGKRVVDAFGQAMNFPAEVTFCLPILSGPFSNAFKHATMELAPEDIGNQIVAF